MSLCPADVELLEQWSATGVVPEDRSTRDFACRLLLKVWADRCQWVAVAADELTGLPHAIPNDERTASVIANAIGFEMLRHNRQIYIGDAGVEQIDITDVEAERCFTAARRVLAHIRSM